MAFQATHEVMLIEGDCGSAETIFQALRQFHFTLCVVSSLADAGDDFRRGHTYLAYIVDENLTDGSGAVLAAKLLAEFKPVVWIGPQEKTPARAIPCPKPIQAGQLQKHFEEILISRLPRPETRA